MCQSHQPAGELELYCPGCGYDLRALDGDVCPECGLRVDRATLGASRIPWAHRARVGPASAYVRTVWLATTRAKQWSQELSNPVSYHDAQRFRWITVALTALPAAAILFTILALVGAPRLRTAVSFVLTRTASDPNPGAYDVFLPWAAGAMWPPVLPLALVLFVACASGVHSYWFHPRSVPVVRQNRAVALSFYVIAPMVWLPVPVMLLLGSIVAFPVFELVSNRSMRKDEYQIVALVLCLSLGVVVALVSLIAFNLIRLARAASGNSLARTVVAAVCIPLAWLASAAVTLFAVPWVVGYVHLVRDSLR